MKIFFQQPARNLYSEPAPSDQEECRYDTGSVNQRKDRSWIDFASTICGLNRSARLFALPVLVKVGLARVDDFNCCAMITGTGKGTRDMPIYHLKNCLNLPWV